MQIKEYTVNEIELSLIIDKLNQISVNCYNSDNDDLINLSFELDHVLDDLNNIKECL